MTYSQFHVREANSRQSGDGDELKEASKTKSSIKSESNPNSLSQQPKFIFKICLCTYSRAAKLNKKQRLCPSLYINSINPCKINDIIVQCISRHLTIIQPAGWELPPSYSLKIHILLRENMRKCVNGLHEDIHLQCVFRPLCKRTDPPTYLQMAHLWIPEV